MNQGTLPTINHDLPPFQLKTCCVVEPPDLTLPYVTHQREEIVEEGFPWGEHLTQMV